MPERKIWPQMDTDTHGSYGFVFIRVHPCPSVANKCVGSFPRTDTVSPQRHRDTEEHRNAISVPSVFSAASVISNSLLFLSVPLCLCGEPALEAL
jgi:hypothetical protein